MQNSGLSGTNTQPVRSRTTRTVVEIGLMLGLFAILDYLGIRLPINIAGGSISLAMLPVLLYALLRGPKLGILLGVLAGSLDMLIQPFFVHPVQFVLDYPAAYGAVGLAGLVSAPVVRALRSADTIRAVAFALAGALIGGAFRFASHFVAGVVFFGSYAPEGQAVWLYSLIYNVSYIGPSLLASALILAAVLVPVGRTVLTDQDA